MVSQANTATATSCNDKTDGMDNSPSNLRMISSSIEFQSGCRGEATVYLCVTLIMSESVSNGDASG